MAIVIRVDKKKHAFAMLDRLDNMRNDKSRSNFKVTVDGNTILAQRDILIAASDYFDAMLSHDTKENQRGEVEMMDVDFECVKICIDFIYGKEISVSPEKYEDLMFVAHMMQLKILCEAIEKMMVENVNLKSFYKLQKISDLYECPLLRKKCGKYAEENFHALSKEKDFNEIDKQSLLSLIMSKIIRISELEKLEVILQWVKHTMSRNSDFADLLNGVDLDKIPIGQRRYFIENEQLISNNFEIYQLFSSSVMNSANIPIDTQRTSPMDHQTQIRNNILIFEIKSEDLRVFNPRTNEVSETRLQNCKVSDEYSVKGQEGYSITMTKEHIYRLGEDKSVHRFKFSEKTATWERMADMIDKHGQHPTAAVVSTHIYVIGGAGRVTTDTVEKYDPSMNKWGRLCRKTVPSNGSAVVALGRSIYSFGGLVGGNERKDVEKLDITRSTWIRLAPMNEERIFMGATVWKGDIIVAGGRNKQKEFLKSVEYYNVSMDQWTMLPSMNIERYVFKLVFVEGLILAVGGHMDNDAKSSIEKYDEQNKKWTKLQLIGGANINIYAAIHVEAEK